VADVELDVTQRRHLMVLRLGSSARLAGIASIAERWRARASQLSGRLGAVIVQPGTGTGWCRLSQGLSGQIWPPSLKRIEMRTIPLNAQQPPTPESPYVELTPGQPVACHEGTVGRLEGVVVETTQGIVSSLLVRVPARLNDQIGGPEDPLAALLHVAGSRVMVPPAWAVMPESHNGSSIAHAHVLHLNATASQVAHSLVLREDADLVQEVYGILSRSPALRVYISEIRVTVSDGLVTLVGPALSPRLRASVEQDVWHIPGVLDVRNELI
jgi:hypothetical protein